MKKVFLFLFLITASFLYEARVANASYRIFDNEIYLNIKSANATGGIVSYNDLLGETGYQGMYTGSYGLSSGVPAFNYSTIGDFFESSYQNSIRPKPVYKYSGKVRLVENGLEYTYDEFILFLSDLYQSGYPTSSDRNREIDLVAPHASQPNIRNVQPGKYYYTVEILFERTSSANSSSPKKKSSVRYVCGDKNADNYDRFGRHKEFLCIYGSNPVKNSDKNICPIFTQYMRIGDRDGFIGSEKQGVGVSNVINEVLLLQKTLTKLGFNPDYNQDGIFGEVTEKAVGAFQLSHSANILDPWGLVNPTGRFYQSTERWMNHVLGCPDDVVLDNGKYLSSDSL